MYCHKCGKDIDEEAVVCPYCGVSTKNFKKDDKPINIVNQASASSSSTAVVRVKKRHSAILDITMIFLTGGLWIFWMIIRG